jgi:hypothetical protein
MTHNMTCVECREPFSASRSDAQTCSHLCRSRRSRRLERERIRRAVVLLESLAARDAIIPED